MISKIERIALVLSTCAIFLSLVGFGMSLNTILLMRQDYRAQVPIEIPLEKMEEVEMLNRVHDLTARGEMSFVILDGEQLIVGKNCMDTLGLKNGQLVDINIVMDIIGCHIDEIVADLDEMQHRNKEFMSDVDKYIEEILDL